MGLGKFGHGRRLVGLGFVAALVLTALVVVAPASATNVRYYVASATSSPSPLKAGKTGTVTVKLQNCKSTVAACGTTTSNAGIGSAKLTFPAGFTVTSVASISPSTWTSSISSGVVKVKGTSSTRVTAGNSLTVTLNVTAPATAGAYTIATKAYYSTTEDESIFSRKGNDASVSVVKPALASLAISPIGSQTAGAPFSVTVTGKDADNNPVEGSSVSLDLLTSPAGAPAFPATSGVLDANGSVTFTNLSLTKAGSYSFRATSGSIQGDSNPFDVGAATLASLSFASQPLDVTAGASFGVTVLGKDQYGNDVSGPSVSLSLGAGSPSGGSLLGNGPSTLAGGSASFSGLSIQKAGTGYTLVASATGVSSVESNPFAVTAAGLSKLAFVQQPTEVVVGALIAPAVTVQGSDAYDNLVTGDVTLTLLDGPSGATLGGTVTAALDASGIATFANLSVDKAGLDARLKADGGTGTTTSATFDIVSAQCTTNNVDCSATTDPNGTGATPTNNTVGLVTVVDNGTGSGDGSLFIKLDGGPSCTGAAGSPVGQALLVVPNGFSGAFAKITVTYDSSITPNASWTYKFCVDKGNGVVKPNIPLCLVGALGYSDNPLLDALSWLFNYGAYQTAINNYVTNNGPCILRRGRISGGDLRVEIYMLATDPRVSGFGSG